MLQTLSRVNEGYLFLSFTKYRRLVSDERTLNPSLKEPSENSTARCRWIADNSSRPPSFLLLDLYGLNKGLVITKDANQGLNRQERPFINGC